MANLKVIILTISDTCSSGECTDTSGPYLAKAVESQFPGSRAQCHIIPDDIQIIKSSLIYYSDTNADVILTSGGTGFTPRDVTPEATRSVIEKEAPGISTAMCVKSLAITHMAMLSRAVCGIRGTTLIINFPGSLKAVKECFDVVKNVLHHAVEQIQGRMDKIKITHSLIREDQICKNATNRSSCNHSRLESNFDMNYVAVRDRQSPFPMIEVDAALKEIIEMMQADNVQKVQKSSLSSCLDCVLAETQTATEPFPPFPASVKDGYACLYEDGYGERKVMKSSVLAGAYPRDVVKTGFCMRINTGAPLPPGADCVVQVEDTRLVESSVDRKEELRINILVPPCMHQDIRAIGSDMKQGELLLAKGTVIGPAEIGILATIGANDIPLFCRPKVAIVSTGNELEDPISKDIQNGHIRDSNKFMLMSLLRDFADCKDFGIARDDPAAMKAAILCALRWCDILVTTGSVSMGERDILKPVLLQDFNASIVFGRLNMKPGKPTTFARCIFDQKPKYIFALPGNPVSALVTSHLLLIPALRYWSGNNEYDNPRIKVALDQDVESLDVRPEYARAVYSYSEISNTPTAILTGCQMSSRLVSARNASLLVRLPSSKTMQCVKKGTLLEAQVIGRF